MSVLSRYYYDYRSNSCRQFTYGGCGGGVNNFPSFWECRAATQRCWLTQRLGNNNNNVRPSIINIHVKASKGKGKWKRRRGGRSDMDYVDMIM